MSWGLIVAAGATLVSSGVQSRSSRKATEAQERQGERALGVQEGEFARFEETLSPFIRGETPEQAQQRALIGLSGPEAQQQAQLALETPTTRRLRQEGLSGLDQRFSAVGGLGGSNRLKALTTFLQDRDTGLAAQKFNQLGALSGQRLGAAQALGGVGSASASGQSQTIQGIGRAQGQGALNQGQAFQSGVEGLGAIGLNVFGQGQPQQQGANISGSGANLSNRATLGGNRAPSSVFF